MSSLNFNPSSNKYFKIAGFIALIVIAVVIIFRDYHQRRDLSFLLKSFNVDMNLSRHFFVIKQETRKGDPFFLRTIFAQGDKDIIKMKIFSRIPPPEARRFVDNESQLMQSLFTDYASPYPGRISMKKTCPDAYRPEFVTSDNSDSLRAGYYLYANERFDYGGCVEDFIKYRAVKGFIYCKAKNEMYQIEYFTPKDHPTQNYREVVNSFRCQ